VLLAVGSLFALLRFHINATWLIVIGGIVGLLAGWMGIA
jgi:xanthosine utilization system XapX-like protein